MKYSKKVNLSVSGVDVKNNILSGAVLANVGFAAGHKVEIGEEQLPMYCDRGTLEQWAAMINSGNKRMSVSCNHSESVTAVFGEIVQGSALVRGPSLLADIRMLPVAFDRSTNFVGEYIMSQAEDGQEFLNLSLESEVGFEPVDVNGEMVAAMRPVTLDGVSFVKEGALTSALFQFAAKKEESLINNNIPVKEQDMKKTETKPEEVNLEAAKPPKGTVAHIVVAPPEGSPAEEASEPVAEAKAEGDAAKVPEVKAPEAKAAEVVPAKEVKADAEEEKVPAPEPTVDEKTAEEEKFGWPHMEDFCNEMKARLAKLEAVLLPPDVGESQTQVLPPAEFEATKLAAKPVEKKEKKAVVLLADVEEGGTTETEKVDLSKAGDREYYLKHKKQIEAIYNSEVKTRRVNY